MSLIGHEGCPAFREYQFGAMSYPLAIMESMTSTIEETRNHTYVTIQDACEGRPVRRVVHCDGIRGVLRQRDQRWSVENEEEVRILAALGGSDRVVDRFQALAATLNAGLVNLVGLTYLNTRLRAIADAENVSRVWIPAGLLPAVAFACTFMPDSNGSRWLAWALSARLDGNLSCRSLPGPGLDTMTGRQKLFAWGYGREIRWIDAMPTTFWDRLNAPGECCPSGAATEVCLRGADQPCLRAVAAASDPRTQPAMLKALARSNDSVVLDLVASHPRTQAHVLLGLGQNRQDYGTQFLVRLRVPQNLSVSPWLLRRLAKNSLWQVRGLAAMNTAMPVSALNELCRDDEQFVRSAVASNENTPEDDLHVLARDGEWQVRRAAASNPSCPVDLIKRMLTDSRREVRRAAVSNPTTPLELAMPFAKDRAMAVRSAVACRSNAPGDVLRALATDDKVRVRRAVAWNQGIPADVSELLSADADLDVRAVLGHNRSTPSTVLRILAGDSNGWVRQCVAENASTPVDLLEEMFVDAESWFKPALAGNESTPAGLLASLAADEWFGVRACVATNTSTPAEVLRSMAADEDAEVRVGVAGNPSTPDDSLKELTTDEDYRARAEAFENLTQRRNAQLAADSQAEKGREE